MVSEPGAFRRGVAVLRHPLFMGHVPDDDYCYDDDDCDDIDYVDCDDDDEEDDDTHNESPNIPSPPW